MFRKFLTYGMLSADCRHIRETLLDVTWARQLTLYAVVCGTFFDQNRPMFLESADRLHISILITHITEKLNKCTHLHNISGIPMHSLSIQQIYISSFSIDSPFALEFPFQIEH